MNAGMTLRLRGMLSGLMGARGGKGLVGPPPATTCPPTGNSADMAAPDQANRAIKADAITALRLFLPPPRAVSGATT